MTDKDLAFQQRLKSVIDKYGSVSAFARKTSISRRTIGAYLSGQSDPTRQKLIELARAAEVNIEWLAVGDADFEHGAVHEPGLDYRVSESVAVYPCFNLGHGLEHGKLSGSARCKDVLLDRRLLKVNGESTRFAVRSVDDTMVPTVLPADLLIVSAPESSMPQNGVHLVALNGRALLRRLQWRSQTSVDVLCDNPAYAPLFLDLLQASDQFSVLGSIVLRLGPLT